MPSFKRKYDPDKLPNLVEDRYPLRPLNLCVRELYRILQDAGIMTGSTIVVSGGGSSGGGGSSLGFTTFDVEWVANGPYREDEAVDGGWSVPTACTIQKLRLWRGTAGRSGSTILDINRTPAGGTKQSLYSTQANRPTIRYTDGDDFVLDCVLPDVVTLAEDDVITVDTDAKEAGLPQHWRLTMEAA